MPRHLASDRPSDDRTDAERDGQTARTFVNGISVYEDGFASKVIEDIKLRGHIYIELRR